MANGKPITEWRKNFQLIGQWLLIVLAIVVGWINFSERLTRLEAAVDQEQRGYNQMIKTLTHRMDRLENKIDILIERSLAR